MGKQAGLFHPKGICESIKNVLFKQRELKMTTDVARQKQYFDYKQLKNSQHLFYPLTRENGSERDCE